MVTAGNINVWLNAHTAAFTTGMQKATAQTQAFGASATAASVSWSAAMTKFTTVPILALSGAAVAAFSSFDSAMTQSLAIMGDVSDAMEHRMADAARKMALETTFSAKQAAESYFFLASAGLNAEASLAALPTVARFARAGMFDMATATDLLTDAQSALGLTIRTNAEDNQRNMLRVSDVLVKANTLANATTQQFSEALTSQAGPAMKQYGIALEEGVAVLAAYADQGIKAQKAGSMFGRFLRLSTKGAVENEKAWKAMGLEMFTAEGAVRPISDVVKDLTGVMSKLSVKQRTVALDMLGFQARSQQAVLPLLGLSDAIEGYESKLKSAGGTTQEIADKQMKSFGAQMKQVWRQIQDTFKSFGEIIAPLVLKIAKAIGRVFAWLNKLSHTQKRWIVTIALTVAAIGPLLKVLGFLLPLIWKLLSFMGPLIGLVLKLATAMKALTVATLTNPFVLMGIAVFAAGAALGYLLGKLELVQKAQNKLAGFFKFMDKKNTERMHQQELEIMNLKKLKEEMIKAKEAEKLQAEKVAEVETSTDRVIPDPREFAPVATKFAGAAEKGTTEAFTAELSDGKKKQDKIAKNTGDSSKTLKEILQAIEAGNDLPPEVEVDLIG